MLLSGNVTAYSATQYLHSPSTLWKICPADEIKIEEIVDNRYDATGWVDAIVPGTAFNSYVEAGMEKSPNFGDNIHNVDRKKYDRSMAYRTCFRIPKESEGNRLWLNFDGINRRGTVYLNGRQLGVLDGFMHRGRYDITDVTDRDGDNTLVVIDRKSVV